MKLAKLSLAAIMAVGALSTVNAANLEEAIKGAELKGFMRYRFYDNTADGSERNRFSNAWTIITPVTDNLTAGATVSVEMNDYAANTANGTDDVTMSKAWFKYTDAAFSVRAGKQEINTPWTEPGYGGSKGVGAVAMYTGVKGWTLAAAAFTTTSGLNQLEKLAKMTAFGGNGDTTLDAGEKNAIGQENLYAAAAIGAIGPVNMQVWAARMTNIFDYSMFVQVDTKMAGVSLLGQMNMLKVNSDVETALTLADDTGMFFGLQAGYAVDNIGIKVGYTSNDDDQPLYTLDEDDAGMLKYGQQIYADTANAADTDTIAAVVNASFGKFGVEAAYIDVESGNTDMDEVYGLVSYKYAKNFNMSAYYSVYDNGTADNDQIRFEAKYSF